ncbi:MAG TPA: hypothetical protein PLR57_00500, partial [Clostridia bacterium]|nr:hypothetical protein [Clostridia bacterium]
LTELVAFTSIERAEEFALAMEQSMARKADRAIMSAVAILHAEEKGYDVSQNAQMLMQIYQSAAAKHRY